MHDEIFHAAAIAGIFIRLYYVITKLQGLESVNQKFSLMAYWIDDNGGSMID